MIHKVDQCLYRRGGFSPDWLSEAKEARFEVIVSLEDDGSIAEQEYQYCMANNIAFYSFPMNEFKRPTPSELYFIAFVLHGFVVGEKKTLIHCKHDQDRTGYVTATYRMLFDGWSFEQAWKECLEYGHKWLFYFWWKESLKGIEGIARTRRGLPCQT